MDTPKLNDEQIAYYDDLLKTDKLDFDDKAIVCHSFFEYFKNQKNTKRQVLTLSLAMMLNMHLNHLI